ncbi:MAG: ABC transporter permease [Nitriliruptorales bacterium]
MTASTAATSPPIASRKGRVWVTWRYQPVIFHVASLLLLLHVLIAVAGPAIAPFEPQQLLTGDTFSRPSPAHLLGTDNFGRDVFSRVVYGERVVLLTALSASLAAVLAGSLIGIASVQTGGWVDQAVNRTVDALMSIPPLIVALLVLSALGSGFLVMVVVVAALFTLRVATVVRAATLGVIAEDFVTAAVLRGESSWSIVRRELLPNVASTVLVELSLRTGMAALFIGGLSFLGFGATPPTPEWGLMINEARAYVTNAPWIVLSPSLALASLVVALSLFTEGLSEALGLAAARSREL